MVRQRLRLLSWLLLVPFGLIVWRLQALQLEPASVAESRRTSERRSHTYTSPQRGRILDRHGVVLAGNRPIYQLNFNHALLNPRSEHLEILVEVLRKADEFPRASEVEANLIEISGLTAILAQDDARLLAPPEAELERAHDASVDGGLDQWLLLVTGLESKVASTLNRRWALLWGRDAPEATRVLEARPDADGQTYSVWFHRRRALNLELTLERLARLLRRTGGDGQAAALRETVTKSLERIDRLVAHEMRREKEEGSGALPGEVIKKERGLRRQHHRQTRLLVSDVPLAVVTEIEYRPELYAGLECLDGVKREYPLREACGTITGWLGRSEAKGSETKGSESKDQPEPSDILKAPWDYESTAKFLTDRPGKRRATDWIGTVGLEAQYDKRLRGSVGLVVARRDSRGRQRKRIVDEPPEHGEDIRTTLDAGLQRRLYEALAGRVQPQRAVDGGTAGSAAVMELPSGALLASVGFPGVDPNRIPEQGYGKELDDLWLGQTKGWMLDRPSSWPIDPGSVFKIVIAAAAMESAQPWNGEFSEARRYPCHYSFELIPKLHCDSENGHTESKSVNLAEALQFSCNNYFYYAGLKHLGPQLMEPWAYNFGYGRPTGVDLPTRFGRGRLAPSSDLELPWQICHFAIGQGFVQATPLQVLRSYAALAVGGDRLPTPYLVKPSRPDKLRFENPRTVSVIRDGLWRVGHSPFGTASHSRLELTQFNAAYKTGTAEVTIGEGALHNGWIAGWAPFDNPKIAFVAVIERTPLHGGDAAAPVIEAILEHFAAKEPELYRVSGGKQP